MHLFFGIIQRYSMRSLREKLSQRNPLHFHGFQTRNLMIKECKFHPLTPTFVGPMHLLFWYNPKIFVFILRSITNPIQTVSDYLGKALPMLSFIFSWVSNKKILWLRNASPFIYTDIRWSHASPSYTKRREAMKKF